MSKKAKDLPKIRQVMAESPRQRGGRMGGVHASPITLYLKRAIRKQCRVTGCTIKQAAEASGINHYTLAGIISMGGHSCPKLERIYDFADAFGIEATSLLPTMEEWRALRDEEGDCDE